MKDRLRQLRKSLDLTLAQFGERIGTTAGAVSNWEHGATIPDVRIYQICKEFNVNNSWLVTGVGDMFNHVETVPKSQAFDTVILSIYNELPPEKRKILEEVASAILDAKNSKEAVERAVVKVQTINGNNNGVVNQF